MLKVLEIFENSNIFYVYKIIQFADYVHLRVGFSPLLNVLELYVFCFF